MSTTTATAAQILAEIEGRAEGAIDIYQMKSFDIVIAATRGYASAIDALLMAEALRAVLDMHRGWHVCVNADGRGSTDYSDSPDDDGLYPCPTVTAITAALGCGAGL